MRRHYLGAARLSFCVLFALAGLQRAFAAESQPSVPDEIRIEAMRPNDDPIGHPLPLACSWTCGHYRSDRSAGWRPENQMRLVEEGHYLLPWFGHPEGEVPADPEAFLRRYYQGPIEKARRTKLPSEAEWEYACRAGTTTRWYCGDDEGGLADVAWFSKNAGGMTHPVGEKRPNAWGLYDMSGNVEQWCADRFSPAYYKQSPPSDPIGSAAGIDRMLRGGVWFHSSSYCRSASRYYHAPALRSRFGGFRVAQVPAE